MAVNGQTKALIFTLFFILFRHTYAAASSDFFSSETFISALKVENSILNKAVVSTDCNLINWAAWNNFTGTSSTGTINMSDGPINITMTSNFTFDSTPQIYNHSKFNSYPSPVPNAAVPRTTWSAGTGGTTTMCFSKTVTNPVLLIASLGSSSGIRAKLNFSLPYVVIYDGGGMEYNSSTALTGTEGYAIIMFPGDFTCVTINSTTPEFYTNITWGVRPPPFTIDITEVSRDCGSVTLTASGGTAYFWNGGENPSSASNIFHESGTYIVTVTNIDGCTTSASKTITVNTSPKAVISGNTSGCGSVSLTASGGVSYLWDGGESPANAVNTFNSSGTYTVAVTDANGCTASTTVKVIVLDHVEPEITITADPAGEICEGTSVTFTAAVANEGTTSSFQWFKNDILVGSGTTYTSSHHLNNDEITCRLTSSTICNAASLAESNKIIMKVNSLPQITFPQHVVIKGPDSIQLDPIINGNAESFLWTPTLGLNDPTIKNPSADPELTTDYQLTVTSSKGCTSFASIRVIVDNNIIIIPNTFTPNGDGVNDTWNILYLSDYPESHINIYNRYGRLLFYSVGYAEPWDGTFKGKLVPTGVYYYTIDFKNKLLTPRTGYITILR